MTFLSRWWPWIVGIIVLLSFTYQGCLPREVRDWNKDHPGLALPSTHFHPIVPGNKTAEDLRRLRDFVQSHVPGAEISITIPGVEMPGWERLPLVWGEMIIWIKRPIVYDRWRHVSA